MTIIPVPVRQRDQYRVHSVTAQRPVAMTVEMFNGLGNVVDPNNPSNSDETVITRVTEVQEKLNWGLILSIAIPLAIIVPILLSGVGSEEK